MSMFSKLKQIKDLRDQAKKMEEVLGQEKMEVQGARGMIKLTMSGKQEIISLVIDPAYMQSTPKDKLEAALKETFNDAVHKVQKAMASKLQSMGGLSEMLGMDKTQQ